MLTRLIIRNYAIISELDMSIKPGLSIITGETGAGKSILLGALGLALGKRADSKVLIDDDRKCIVEAHFMVNDQLLKPFFEEADLDFSMEMICRREISSGGRSRSFINDTPVSLKVMQELTSHLIELHHQHDNLALQSKDQQVRVLDTLSNSIDIYQEYKLKYHKYLKLQQDLSQLRALEISSAQKKDFLQFQLDELANAKLISGEIIRLEESENILKHAETIDHSLTLIQQTMMDGQHSIHHQLTQILKQLESIKNISEPITVISSRIDALRIEVQDIALEAGRLDGFAKQDPAQLAKVETRLSQLYSLIKKYNVKDEEELLEKQSDLKTEISTLTSVGEKIQTKENEISELQSDLIQKAQDLSKLRKSGALKIVSQIQDLLKELGMPNGKFLVEMDAIPLGPDGADDIRFMFSANKGMPLFPLHQVASGGELSRLSLALKSLYAAHANLPTIIFDEIDTGISGEVAWRMGQLIRALALNHQILMITHSPQIAAHASTQYHVSKVITKGKDTSSVQLLTKDMRLTEIAKMLSGDPPSKEALANARSLVEATKN